MTKIFSCVSLSGDYGSTRSRVGLHDKQTVKAQLAKIAQIQTVSDDRTLGIAIVSTSKGVMTDRAARAAGIGGEVLCTVF